MQYNIDTVTAGKANADYSIVTERRDDRAVHGYSRTLVQTWIPDNSVVTVRQGKRVVIVWTIDAKGVYTYTKPEASKPSTKATTVKSGKAKALASV